jgi:formate hydrogenlyase subunit 3/multisubunit Na+/H+ antiporter MnhD subunit
MSLTQLQLNEVAAAQIAAWLLLGALAPAIARRRFANALVYGGCALLAATQALVAFASLALPAGADALLALPVGLPMSRTLLGWDPLSATFGGLINVVCAIVSVYAIGYGRHESEPERVLPFYPAFLAGMNLVLLANDAFSFLIGWEFMSLASWALVISQHRDAGNRQAGLVYLVMAFGGTLALLTFFGFLSGGAGSYGFAEIRATNFGGVAGPAILLLGLAGTGSKAGLLPLHAWLPLAHPAAPSHVSSLMSGVMTKVAVYAFTRFAFDLVAPDSGGYWLGGLLVALGAMTAVYGVVAALLETDIKRVLAFSTIENIGIVFGALGLSLAFQAAGFGAAAALALTTALLHSVNHAFMKSALFMGAGALVNATGQRDLDTGGGLIRRMPHTAATMLIASAAIAALPPLNGFVSEWLLFQAVLASPALSGWFLKLVVPAAGAAFALAAALAAAAFVRLFGIAFLGRPRSDAAREATETDTICRVAMLATAGACVVLGALPALAIEPLQVVVRDLIGLRMPDGWGGPWRSLVPMPTSASSYNGLIVLIFVASSAVIAAIALRLIASGAVRRVPAWDCGYPDARPGTQYSAVSFAQPLQRVFGSTLFGAREQVSMPPPGDTRAAVATVTWRDLPWQLGYRPLAGAVLWLAERLNALQFLTIRRYLMLVFAALVMLLVVVASWH